MPPTPESLAAQLARAQAENRELAYAVSHDLRQPLRAILHQLEFLERRHAAELSPEATLLLQRALAATRQGQEMIDALLVYSRLETRPTPPEVVPLTELLARVQRDLQALVAESGAQVATAGPLPALLGDPQQLRLLFHHLVHNALHYRRSGVAPRLVITAQSDATTHRLSITDNGMGMGPEELARLGKPFTRLHPGGAHPGTGMGVAICRRIADRHGARLRFESVVGQGTTVHVEWPVASPEALAAAAAPRLRVQRATPAAPGDTPATS